MLTFQILDGGDAYYRPFEDRPMVIGRDPSADIQLTEVGVEKFHARIEVESGAGDSARCKIVCLAEDQTVRTALLVFAACVTLAAFTYLQEPRPNRLQPSSNGFYASVSRLVSRYRKPPGEA